MATTITIIIKAHTTFGAICASAKATGKEIGFARKGFITVNITIIKIIITSIIVIVRRSHFQT